MKRALLIAATVSLPLMTAAHRAPPAERHFSEPAFDAVELVGPDRLRILPGPAIDVIASASPDVLASLDIGVRAGRLRVSRKPGSYHDHGAIITVTMPHIRAARLSGSGDMTVSRFDQDGFEAVSAGSGDLTIDAMRVRRGSFSLAGSGDLDLDSVTATDLELTVQGSGDLDASGTTRSASIRLAGSGDIDTRRLHADDAEITLAGSGDIDAFAARQARVVASGTGDVSISGHPRCSVSGSHPERVDCK